MNQSSWLGQSGPATHYELTHAQWIDFHLSVGWNADGLSPMVFTCFRRGEFEIFERLKIALNEVLHAQQKYHWSSKFKQWSLDTVLHSRGLDLIGVTQVTQVVEKSNAQGDSLIFVELTTAYSERTTSEKLVQSVTTVVLRRSREKNHAIPKNRLQSP